MSFLLKSLKRGLLPLLLLPVLLPSFAMAQTCNTKSTPTTNHLVDNNNGTISDPKTGLIWKKCSEGQAYNSGTNSCDNGASGYGRSAALKQAEDVNAGNSGENLGEADWRVPNINELKSIVELSCFSPAINEDIFPNIPSASRSFWSSSSFANNPGSSWRIDFLTGFDGRASELSKTLLVRLVRSGQ